jgi:hypothetical protein
MDIQVDQVEVGVSLYDAGPHPDDVGCRYVAESYFILATTEAGRCFAHNVDFNGAEVWTDPEGYSGYQDVRKEAKAKADALCAKINKALKAGCPLDPTYWRELPPAYGSEAYQEAYSF